MSVLVARRGNCGLGRVSTGAGIALTLLGLLATELAAHGVLRRSTPAADARLEAAPREIRLAFSEPVQLAVTRVALMAPDSTAVLLGPLRPVPDSSRVVVAEIRGPLRAGRHRVLWQTLGADGHPVRGSFTFEILREASGLLAPPAPDTTNRVGPPPGPADAGAARPLDPGAGSDPAAGPFGVGSPAYAAVRWLTYGAVLQLIGAVTLALIVLPRGRASDTGALPRAATQLRDRTARFALGGCAILAVAIGARLVAQLIALDAGAPGTTAPATLLTRTLWGWAWLLQLGAAVVVATGLLAARRGRAGGWLLAAFGAAVLAATLALSGHAASTPRFTALAVIADSVHVLAAGAWMGGLLSVMLVGVPALVRGQSGDRWNALAELIAAFSPTALASALLLVITGTIAAWLQLGEVAELVRSSYGRVLLVKLALLVVLWAVGAFNWRRVRPTLHGEAGSRTLRRSAGVELAVGALVLAVTAVLVATPPPVHGP